MFIYRRNGYVDELHQISTGPTYIPLILQYSRSDKLVNNNIINHNGTSCNRSRGAARKKDQTDLAKARLRTVLKDLDSVNFQ